MGDPVAVPQFNSHSFLISSQKAYICNLQEHWFTMRKIGTQWFNLNSLLSGPELISDTYLSLFLTQLQQEGYSIFIVTGIFPDCTADAVLATTKVTQASKPRLLSEAKKTAKPGEKFEKVAETRGADGFTDDERRQMEVAIQMSLSSNAQDEQKQLEAAMAASLGPSSEPAVKEPRELTDEEQLEAALRMSLEKPDNNAW